MTVAVYGSPRCAVSRQGEGCQLIENCRRLQSTLWEAANTVLGSAVDVRLAGPYPVPPLVQPPFCFTRHIVGVAAPRAAGGPISATNTDR